MLVSSRLLLFAEARLCPPEAARDWAAEARVGDLDLGDFQVEPGVS